MLKTTIKNLIRFFCSTVIAFLLLKAGLGYYLLDIIFTLLVIISYAILGDLSNYFKVNSFITKMMMSDNSKNNIVITATIYIGAALTPLANLLSNKIL